MRETVQGGRDLWRKTKVLLQCATCMGHGWIVLPPNSWNESIRAFQRVEELASGEVVRLRVQQPDSKHVAVTVWSARPLRGTGD